MCHSLVEQERLILLQHLKFTPSFQWGLCYSIFSFIHCMYVLQIIVCPLLLFLLAIVLSVLHRYTDSDYPFDIFKLFLPYSQRHYSVINHCDRCTNVSLILVIWIYHLFYYISSKFLLHLECYLLSPKRHTKISKQIKQTKRYISITKKSDMSITVINHTLSLTVLYQYH